MDYQGLEKLRGKQSRLRNAFFSTFKDSLIRNVVLFHRLEDIDADFSKEKWDKYDVQGGTDFDKLNTAYKVGEKYVFGAYLNGESGYSTHFIMDLEAKKTQTFFEVKESGRHLSGYYDPVNKKHGCGYTIEDRANVRGFNFAFLDVAKYYMENDVELGVIFPSEAKKIRDLKRLEMEAEKNLKK